MRSYLNRHRIDIRQVAFFCTLGGSGQDKVFNDMNQLYSKPAVATLALTQAQVDAHRTLPAVARFARELGSRRRSARVSARALVS